MTITRGGEWGRLVEPPRDLAIADDDPSVIRLLGADRRGRVLLADGDLARTMGSSAIDRDQVLEVSVDLVRVTTDAGEHVACAHVMVRSPRRRGSWWHGPVIAVMNAQTFGRWEVAPRGHPNDGRLEVQEYSASLNLRQRLAIRSRLREGTHVPHPLIRSRAVGDAEWTFGRRLDVIVDGADVVSTSYLRVEVDPDAAVVYR